MPQEYTCRNILAKETTGFDKRLLPSVDDGEKKTEKGCKRQPTDQKIRVLVFKVFRFKYRVEEDNSENTKEKKIRVDKQTRSMPEGEF